MSLNGRRKLESLERTHQTQAEELNLNGTHDLLRVKVAPPPWQQGLLPTS